MNLLEIRFTDYADNLFRCLENSTSDNVIVKHVGY